MSRHPHVPGNDEVQTPGRKANAAEPLEASGNTGGAERYPSVRKDDAAGAEDRSSAGKPGNPEPPQGAGDGGPAPATRDGKR